MSIPPKSFLLHGYYVRTLLRLCIIFFIFFPTAGTISIRSGMMIHAAQKKISFVSLAIISKISYSLLANLCPCKYIEIQDNGKRIEDQPSHNRMRHIIRFIPKLIDNHTNGKKTYNIGGDNPDRANQWYTYLLLCIINGKKENQRNKGSVIIWSV